MAFYCHQQFDPSPLHGGGGYHVVALHTPCFVAASYRQAGLQECLTKLYQPCPSFLTQPPALLLQPPLLAELPGTGILVKWRTKPLMISGVWVWRGLPRPVQFSCLEDGPAPHIALEKGLGPRTCIRDWGVSQPHVGPRSPTAGPSLTLKQRLAPNTGWGVVGLPRGSQEPGRRGVRRENHLQVIWRQNIATYSQTTGY